MAHVQSDIIQQRPDAFYHLVTDAVSQKARVYEQQSRESASDDKMRMATHLAWFDGQLNMILTEVTNRIGY